MKKYNKEQLLAINSVSKHTAVIAGAGTGKTTVLVERIKKILADDDSITILAVTFTKKAAKEMKERLQKEKVYITTFDAFCYNLIGKETKIIDDNIPFTKTEILSFHLYDLDISKKCPYNYSNYVSYKKENNLWDFNDVEKQALKIIKARNISYDYILVDEFQDTNYLQYQIFKALINKNTKTFVVGDPDQSIYRFRGSSPKIINLYNKEFASEVIILNTNYRSNEKIIKVANRLLENNVQRIKKRLVNYKEKNGIVNHLLFNNDSLEYNYVINKYQELKDKYQTFAILFRNHSLAYWYKLYFNKSYDRVDVLSIHEAKGLEFDVVFIVGLNADVFPTSGEKSIALIEEERRLLFVGLTRAKEELYLTSMNKESKFIKELKQKEIRR
ncbi:MAG: ATP-dependent helicase [Acholeplasma sp.]|nr:ATP-dependent helicase [Acholeplasma sp.]